MSVIKIAGLDTILEAQPGESLLDVLATVGLLPASPCGGSGVCGKCAVTVRGAGLDAPTQQEIELFTADELARGRRLACQLFPQGDLEVSVPLEGQDSAILSHGYLPAFTLDPAVTQKRVTLKPGQAASYEKRLAEALGEARLDARVLRGLPWQREHLRAIYDGGRLLAITDHDSEQGLYGLAVDIGTTTVVVSLHKLFTGEELAVRSAINPQKQWGFDVLNRLSFVLEHPGQGLNTLQKAVVDCLNALCAELCADTGVPASCIYNIAVAANTSMMHVLLGIDPSPLGTAPFTPLFTEAKSLSAAEIGLHAAHGAVLYCLPSVSAYIGADIVAGMLVSQLSSATKTTLFIDIGTNGEMVLSHEGQLCACSCAAGPALEGMNISSGMRACSGAIEDVSIGEDGLRLRTINHAPPLGLCGSGILSAVGEFLRIGLILPRGNLVKARDLPRGDPRQAYLCEVGGKPALQLVGGDAPVYVTQKDIRQVQLAKGALLSGIFALLARKGLEIDDIGCVLIAGQFGAHLPVASLTACGIIPQALADRVAYLGNTSKSGAAMALLSRSARNDMEELASQVSYVELGTVEGFDRLFVACLDFPPPAS